jgi:BolA protein
MPDIERAGKLISGYILGAEVFHGKSRLERHRMVNETLVAELKGGVHALAIHATPGEAGG